MDENFTLNKERVLKICDEICRKDFKDIELNCNNGICADRLEKEILSAMRRADFKYFAFGIESGNEQVLKNIKKGVDINVIEEALEAAIKLDYYNNFVFYYWLTGGGHG
ncbi:MAG: hypothetical protein CMD96_08970 [Gammaproteobacteria bacterium]|nr:hypothetical protein [Gammaproteobacteria bacterium]HJP17077.1 hypothetical protein [Nitrospinota bacterium]